jgi:hydroxymethylpyrimidine/phosphomethylpyrimidine kinase
MANPSLTIFTPQNKRFEAPSPPCAMAINANDPCGAGGVAADIQAFSSVGVHPLPICTGSFARDTAQIFDFYCLGNDAIEEQARAALQDCSIGALKIGFLGHPDAIGSVAALANDYPHLQIVAYMPDLSWWETQQIDSYLEAFAELLLPHVDVLVGNHSTLARWLLPDWGNTRAPNAREIAQAAGELGAACTLALGFEHDGAVLDVLSNGLTNLCEAQHPRLDARYIGAGDTLSAALTGLMACGVDVQIATPEALSYLHHSLQAGFTPGMGHALPQRLFWAQTEEQLSGAATSGEASLCEV